MGRAIAPRRTEHYTLPIVVPVLLGLFTGVGLLLILLAVPLMRRSVRPNGWYGLRVAATFADEWVWYEANARSGRDLFILGTIQIVIAIATAVLRVPETAYAIVNIAMILLGTVTFAIIGVRRANRLLVERQGNAATA